jgi:hypothetical protein
MKPLPIRWKTAVLCLAAFFTFASAAMLDGFLPDRDRAPAPLLAATDVGCEFNPSRTC